MSSPSPRLVALAAILLLAGVAPVAPADVPQACDEALVPVVGLACAVPGGWLVRLADGLERVTHGVDVLDEGAAATYEFRGPPKDPVCAEPDTPHAEIIYVLPENTPDLLEERRPMLHDMVRQANGHLAAEAMDHGVYAAYRFLCGEDGLPVVHRLRIPYWTVEATFRDIVNEAVAQGHASPTAKYWMWMESGNRGMGIAFTHDDDRLAPDNEALGAPDYALTYGVEGGAGILVLMHESAHNLGAVQDSAPHTTGSAHCNDGLDVMCYMDGGPTSDYSESVCGPYRSFDCNRDDYFHPDPPSGSYLASHWNLGHAYNAFFEFGRQDPVFHRFRCVEGADPLTAVCSFAIRTPEADVHALVDWGDGTTERLPATGHVPSMTPLETAHVFASEGAYDLVFTPVDAEGHVGAARAFRLTLPWTEPSIEMLAPADGAVVEGVAAVEGTVASDRPPLAVRVEVDGVPVGEAVVDGTTWSYAWATDALAEGPHAVRAVVTDSNGVEAFDVADVVVSRPPVVRIDRPLENSHLGRVVEMYGAATDPNGVVAVDWAVDDGPWRPAEGTTSWRASWDTTEVPQGPHVLRIRATDATGRAFVAERTHVVDHTPPSVEVVRPRANSVHVSDGLTLYGGPALGESAVVIGQTTIRVAGSDAYGYLMSIIVCVENLDRGTPQECTRLTISPWEVYDFYDLVTLDRGRLRITAQAFDAAANPSPVVVRDVVRV